MGERIAMISFHTCPLASQEGKETGGMNVYVLELAKELAKQGHSVDVFTRIQDEISPEVVNFSPRFRVIHLKAGHKSPIAKKNLINYLPEFSRQLIRFIKKNKIKYDVIHCHYYLSGLVALQLRHKYKLIFPLIMTFHTLGLMKNLVARSHKEKESKRRINSEFRLIKYSDQITGSSISDKEYLISLYNCPENKITVISPGVDTNLFKPIPKQTALDYIQSHTKDKIILFVGRVEPLKGIDVLIYALKIYLSRNPHSPIKLLIVGGDSNNNLQTNKELHRLKQLEKTLKISPVVGYISQRPQHELPYYYNAAEVLLMPSHYESFGLTALEAMACGITVITTDTSGISGLIDEEFKDLIISANNPLLLAKQIEIVLYDKKRHEKMRQAMLEKIKCLSWENVAQKTLTVYFNVLKH